MESLGWGLSATRSIHGCLGAPQLDRLNGVTLDFKTQDPGRFLETCAAIFKSSRVQPTTEKVCEERKRKCE